MPLEEPLKNSTGPDCAPSCSTTEDECEAHTWASRAEHSPSVVGQEGVQDGSRRVGQRFLAVPTLVAEGAELPTYTTEGAVGADVRSLTSLTIEPGESALIPTGLRMAIPEGYEIQVRPRSGLALKHQLTVLNSPGTIDSDYRGEIGVILINHGKKAFVVEEGMRIAQLILAPVVQANFILHEDLVASTRGEGGFGHTGVSS